MQQAQTPWPGARCWSSPGPKLPLLPAEVEAIRAYLAAGGNALFMLDPFVAHRARAGRRASSASCSTTTS